MMRSATWLVLGSLGFPTVGVHAQTSTAVEEFLRGEIGFSAAEIGALGRGEAVAKLLPAANDREVTVFGAVRVAAPRSAFLQHSLDFQRSLRGSTRPLVGIFSNPAKVEDAAAFQVTRDDIEDVRSCRPGSCDFKLPATDIERLRTSFDLSAADAPTRVAGYARTRMVELVTDYRRRGNQAMAIYADRGNVAAAQAFEQMLAATSFVYRRVPSFQKHLLEYPKSTLPGASEIVYWAVDEMPRMRPVLRVSHQIVYSPPELQSAALVASKLIYANHYFEAGLEVLLAVDGGTPPSSNEITLLLLRRYRFDNLPGGVLNIRQRVSNAVRDQSRDELLRRKGELEKGTVAPFRSGG